MSAPPPPSRDDIVVGLDIGTTKVGTVIASGQGDGTLTILGVGIVPSRGIKRGVVVDVADTVSAIQESVERAAHMAGVKALRAVAGITGDHIESFNARGSVTVSSALGTVSRTDVERVLAAAALEVPRDREIVHSLPRDFSVDGHAGVKRPIGMAGSRLEVETHIVTGRASFLQNSVQCVQKAGLDVEALVLEPIATAEAVTTLDERDMGVILLDIGGGTSDIAVFSEGSIIYSGVLPIGGNHVTRDIAIGLRTPFELAEQLKLDSGAATRDLIPHGEALEVLMAGSNERLRIPRSLLGEIIEARMSELFELARQMMHDAGVKKRLPGGVILAGGGALLPGAVELGEAVFQMPTRLGFPRDLKGWSEQVSMPQLATGVGLCRFALKQRLSPGNQTQMAPVLSVSNTGERKVWGGMSESPQVSNTQTPGSTPFDAAISAPAPTLPAEIGVQKPPVIEEKLAPIAEKTEAPKSENPKVENPKAETRKLLSRATSPEPAKIQKPEALPAPISPGEGADVEATNTGGNKNEAAKTPATNAGAANAGIAPSDAQKSAVATPETAKTEVAKTEVAAPVSDALADLRQNIARRDSSWREAKAKGDEASAANEENVEKPRSLLGKWWFDLKVFLGFEADKWD